MHILQKAVAFFLVILERFFEPPRGLLLFPFRRKGFISNLK